MVRSCSAICCTNRFRKDRPDVHFFRFPLKRQSVLKHWVKAMRQKNWHPTASSSICSDHFLPTDFKPNVNGSTKLILKPRAVPSQFNFPHNSSKKLNPQNFCNQDFLQKNIKLIQTQQQPININTSASTVEVKKEVPDLLLFPVATITSTLNKNILNQNPVNGVLCYGSSSFQISENTDSANTSDFHPKMNKKISKCHRKKCDDPLSPYCNFQSLSSEDNLKLDVEIMTRLYERALKKLKACQEDCKRHVKRIVDLEEVIDNLRQINSVTEHN